MSAPLKQHALSAAFPAMSAQELSASHLTGIHSGNPMVMLEVFPSEHQGYSHYRLTRGSPEWTSEETKCPVSDASLGEFLLATLRPFALHLEDMEWRAGEFVRSAPPPPKPGVDVRPRVYFIGAGRFVKIGKCTGTPERRMDDLQTGCPYPMRVLGTFLGDLEQEFAMHRRFAAFHAHGEWFHHRGELAAFIKALPEVTP